MDRPIRYSTGDAQFAEDKDYYETVIIPQKIEEAFTALMKSHHYQGGEYCISPMQYVKFLKSMGVSQ